ncbi:hypothetical protein ACN47E_002315 [Coniothyrium glycines]
MKFTQAFALVALATQINAAAVPEAEADNTLHILPVSDRSPHAAPLFSPDHTLEKRKGGGGRGGGSSGGGSSSGGGGRTGGSSRTSGTSNTGGATSAGSGVSRGFGGGRYYGGGAATPYKSGGRTPNGLVAGALIAPVALLAIMPGIWLYNAYPYYYNNPYRFYNQSARKEDNDNNNDRRALRTRQSTGANETLPVICLCQDFAVCGCDENSDQTYINDLIGNGSYAALNKTLVTVSQVNGTKTLVLNGTLENGTTAPGGTDDDEGVAMHLSAGKYAGYWMMGLVVLYGVFV